jgi:hypothetical protein
MVDAVLAIQFIGLLSKQTFLASNLLVFAKSAHIDFWETSRLDNSASIF